MLQVHKACYLATLRHGLRMKFYHPRRPFETAPVNEFVMIVGKIIKKVAYAQVGDRKMDRMVTKALLVKKSCSRKSSKRSHKMLC